jgi:hypothetical protein
MLVSGLVGVRCVQHLCDAILQGGLDLSMDHPALFRSGVEQVNERLLIGMGGRDEAVAILGLHRYCATLK